MKKKILIKSPAEFKIVNNHSFCKIQANGKNFCFSHGAASGLDVTMEGSHSVTHSVTQSLTQSDRQSWDITLASAITLV